MARTHLLRFSLSTKLLFALPALCALALPGRVDACRCVELDVAAAADRAQLVFSGRVVAVESFSTFVAATIEADRVWKGPIAGRLRVSTGESSAACGVPFAVGERFVVYALDELPQCEFPYRSVSTTTCDRTRAWSEEESAALDELFGGALWNAPARAFRRGDINLDGGFDLSDAVAALHHLFAGVPSTACLDALDMNDSGVVDLSDPVYGLNYLFTGGPSLPPPGSDRPGFDPTVDDPFVCGDDVELSCPSDSSSTLPGVRLDVVGGPCVIGVEEALGGVAFTYRLLVEEALEGVYMQQLGSCQRTGPGGFLLLATIAGDKGERYCLCDTGKCFPVSYTTDVELGSGSDTLYWCGHDWFGPSDFGNPVGKPFPPGTYRFEVRGTGTWVDEDGNESAFEISAGYDFELVADE